MCVILICLVLTALSVEAGGYGQPGLYSNYQGEYAGAYDNYEPRSYAFEYGVSDPHTGDHKSQWETKDKAGVVRGSYSLLESDGSTRIVDYVADDHGFRAVVKKLGVHGQPESVESHGGAAEEGVSFGPIVVAEPGYVEEPLPVEEPLYVKQAAPAPLGPPVHVEPTPVFQSYDGGVEHYRNIYSGQPYNIPVPKSEGVYVEVPKHDLGGYLLQQTFTPKQVYVEQSYPNHGPNAFVQQPYVPPQQEIYAQQPYVSPAGYAQQPLFAPNFQQPHIVPQPQLQSEILAPNVEGVYPQHGQYTTLEGNAALTHSQSQAHVVPEGKLADLDQSQPFALAQAEPVTYQNHEQRPIANDRIGGAYGVQLPVAQYHLEQVYPGGNQILAESPRITYGGSQHDVSSQSYENPGHEREGGLVLNEGEYFPSGAAGVYQEPLPYKYVTGRPVLHK